MSRRTATTAIIAVLGIVVAGCSSQNAATQSSASPPVRAAAIYNTDKSGCQDDEGGDQANNNGRGGYGSRLRNSISPYVTTDISKKNVPPDLDEISYTIEKQAAPPIYLGQKYPTQDRGAAKEYQYSEDGAGWVDDWGDERQFLNCNLIPFALGQPGKRDGDDALDQPDNRGGNEPAWDYDGKKLGDDKLWWGGVRWNGHWGPKGMVRWTCRGNPAGVGYHAKQLEVCAEPRFEAVDAKVQWDTYRPTEKKWATGLRKRDLWGCAVQSGAEAIGCTTKAYKGPWNNFWRFENTIWAPAIRVDISSTAQDTSSNPVNWSIESASPGNGGWPVAAKGFPKSPDVDKAYVIPSNGKSFNISAWGNPNTESQSMTLRLKAGGEWPSGAPTVTITVQYNLKRDVLVGCQEVNYYSTDAGAPTEGSPCVAGYIPITSYPTIEKEGKTVEQPDGSCRVNRKDSGKSIECGISIDPATKVKDEVVKRWIITIGKNG